MKIISVQFKSSPIGESCQLVITFDVVMSIPFLKLINAIDDLIFRAGINGEYLLISGFEDGTSLKSGLSTGYFFGIVIGLAVGAGLIWLINLILC